MTSTGGLIIQENACNMIKFLNITGTTGGRRVDVGTELSDEPLCEDPSLLLVCCEQGCSSRRGRRSGVQRRS